MCKESLDGRPSYTRPIYFECTDYMYKCKYRHPFQRLHIQALISEHQKVQDTLHMDEPSPHVPLLEQTAYAKGGCINLDLYF